MYLKRKSSHFSIEEDDEEDEWEREASSSISSRKQPQQPNPTAIQIDILDEQYETLCNTRKDLEEELKQLQETIRQLDQEVDDLATESIQVEQEYLDSIEKTISMINSTINIKDGQEDDTIQINSNTDYITHDELLSKELKSRVEDWEDVLGLVQNEEEIEQKIKSLAHAYKYTEFEYIDLVAQINGYEARIQSLDRDRSKLNSLPQLLPILKSDTEKYQLEMEHAIALLTKLEKETIRPRLIKLAELKISQPLLEDQLLKDAKLINDLLDDYEHLYDISMKQRACQQLVTYVYSQIQSATNSNIETLESITSALEDQANHVSLEDKASHLSIDDGLTEINENSVDENLTKLIKNLLDEFFASKKDIALFTSITKDDMTLVDQIHALQEYERNLKKKWEEDFQSCLDAAKELDGLQSRLSQTLYVHSNSTDNLIMTPKPYAQLQNELEFRTDELKAGMSELQKYINNTEDNAIFHQQRELFSLFYTDPDKFVELHQEYANNNNDDTDDTMT